MTGCGPGLHRRQVHDELRFRCGSPPEPLPAIAARSARTAAGGREASRTVNVAYSGREAYPAWKSVSPCSVSVSAALRSMRLSARAGSSSKWTTASGRGSTASSQGITCPLGRPLIRRRANWQTSPRSRTTSPERRRARTVLISTFQMRTEDSRRSSTRGDGRMPDRAHIEAIDTRPAGLRRRQACCPEARAASTTARAAVVFPAPSIPVRTMSRTSPFLRRANQLLSHATQSHFPWNGAVQRGQSIPIGRRGR